VFFLPSISQKDAYNEEERVKKNYTYRQGVENT
jgi:hypothetical protein